jgi:hypothetical protein
MHVERPVDDAFIAHSRNTMVLWRAPTGFADMGDIAYFLSR